MENFALDRAKDKDWVGGYAVSELFSEPVMHILSMYCSVGCVST